MGFEDERDNQSRGCQRPLSTIRLRYVHPGAMDEADALLGGRFRGDPI
jgi:hypothetical protein